MPARAQSRETIILSADDEPFWDIFTESPTVQRVLRQLAQHGAVCEAVGNHGMRCRIPKSWLRFDPSEEARW